MQIFDAVGICTSGVNFGTCTSVHGVDIFEGRCAVGICTYGDAVGICTAGVAVGICTEALAVCICTGVLLLAF